MLARLAQNFYWIGRYIERAENIARMVDTSINIAYDYPKDDEYNWKELLLILGSQDLFKKLYDFPTESNIVHFLFINPKNPNSIISSIDMARYNTRSIRELLPREIWEHINEFNLWMKEISKKGIPKKNREDFIKHVIRSCKLFDGLLDSSLIRSRPFDFIMLGRNIERCDMVTRILDIQSFEEYDEYWESLQCGYILHAVSAYQMFRVSNKGTINRSQVTNFLFENSDFPRSVAYCLHNVERSLKRLPSSSNILLALNSTKNFHKSKKKKRANREELTEYIDQFQKKLGDLHQEIATHFFAI